REWKTLESLIRAIFGERDDIDFDAFGAVARDGDAAQTSALQENLQKLPPPRINTAYVPYPDSLVWKSKTQGLRVFGQRYTRPAQRLQQILESGRPLPSGLDIAADLLGSKRARALLE